MSLIVGIAGKKRSGKDTVAKMMSDLAQELGITAERRAMADALKEECATMITNESLRCSGKEIEPLDIVKKMNTDDAKEDYRLLLQWWGTEFKRGMVRDDYWTKCMKGWIKEHKTSEIILIPDVRFPNEVEMIKELGGMVVLVIRPSVDVTDEHVSERALDSFKGWDGVIVNDSSLEELRGQIFRDFTDLLTWAGMATK